MYKDNDHDARFELFKDFMLAIVASTPHPKSEAFMHDSLITVTDYAQMLTNKAFDIKYDYEYFDLKNDKDYRRARRETSKALSTLHKEDHWMPERRKKYAEESED